jgi:4-alpha-glucanotransferase
MNLKFSALKDLFAFQKNDFFGDPHYVDFFEVNRHWLVPYAAFCFLRDQYQTADFSQWESYSNFNAAAVQLLVSPDQQHYEGIAIHYFIQYHLHLQLKEVTAYAHANGIVIKGDLPIGIYRYGCDAWMSPELYHMDVQAGAPPDDFAVKGQNWGFPTYNWNKMQEDGFAWWRRRFEQMSEYFDAFRIDHILGFFRIWSIPLHAVEGIMGKFVPAIPIHLDELHQQGISFQYQRYCKPYIPPYIINEIFGVQADFVKANFLFFEDAIFKLLPNFDTQRKVANHFQQLPQTTENQLLMCGLFELISNVIFFEEEESQAQQFHFRINMDQTTSFRDLDDNSKWKLKQLYIDYYYHRQDEFWRSEAMKKLPKLKRSTNMLVCGEDLGMVPACVPEAMRQLGILSLEIERMPKQANKEFFHPSEAPYLSVITPSTHDMSTIRGWWEENTEKTQRFYNSILGHTGAAPAYCSAAINEQILIQHLQSPAMWCVFQLQDVLGMDAQLRRANPNEERINLPADPKHYWNYRVHLWLDDLVKNKGFINQVHSIISESGR